MSKKSKNSTPTEGTNQDKAKEGLRIPLRLIPNDAETLAEEMREIFDEDKIVHRHGSSEPERD